MQRRLPAFTHWIMSARGQLMFRRMMIAGRHRRTRRFICAVFGAVTGSAWEMEDDAMESILESRKENGWITFPTNMRNLDRRLIQNRCARVTLEALSHPVDWDLNRMAIWNRPCSSWTSSWFMEANYLSYSNRYVLSLNPYLTKLAFRSQSLELIVLAERMEPFTNGSILLFSGK